MPVIQGGFGLTGTDSSRRITVTTESALRIFENVAVLQMDQYARALGLYGDVTLGSDLKARFASFSLPKHLLSNRKNGCSWNPKGGIRLNVEEFPTCPVEFDGEQCPDVFYGTCFERLFGPGNAVRDLAGTAEGQAILAAMLRRIYQALGNSQFDLYNFANHPLISEVNAAGAYNVSTPEWEDYVDQMLSGDCGGLITQLDALKSGSEPGLANFRLDIPDVNSAGKYIGDPIELFETLKENAPAELQTAIESGTQDVSGARRDPIMLVTPQIFNAYKAWIRSIAGTNELAYRYTIENSDGTTRLMKNVLMYDSMPIVRWDAHAPFDAITGAISHRAAIVAPGVFGVLHDVANLDQWGGQGLMIEQSRLLKDKGKIYMSTTYRWGAGIADTNFIVMASNILHP